MQQKVNYQKSQIRTILEKIYANLVWDSAQFPMSYILKVKRFNFCFLPFLEGFFLELNYPHAFAAFIMT